MNWFCIAVKKTFDFKGRARREEYACFIAVSFLIQFSLSILGTAASMLRWVEMTQILFIVSSAVSLLFTIIGISASTRRLHDLGYSGWIQLLIFIPIMFAIYRIEDIWWILTRFMFFIGEAGLVFTYFIMLVFILVLIFKDGQRFTNKYGKDPKASLQTETEISPKIEQKF